MPATSSFVLGGEEENAHQPIPCVSRPAGGLDSSDERRLIEAAQAFSFLPIIGTRRFSARSKPRQLFGHPGTHIVDVAAASHETSPEVLSALICCVNAPKLRRHGTEAWASHQAKALACPQLVRRCHRRIIGTSEPPTCNGRTNHGQLKCCQLCNVGIADYRVASPLLVIPGVSHPSR